MNALQASCGAPAGAFSQRFTTRSVGLRPRGQRVREENQRWVEDVYSLLEAQDVDEALFRAINGCRERLSQKRAEELDGLLLQLDCGRLGPDGIVAFLVGTNLWRELVPSRSTFAARAERWLRANVPERASALLVGLV